MAIKLRTLTGLLTGFNWYRLGIYALILGGYTAAVGGYAYHRASLSCEKEKTEAAKVIVREVIKEVKVRVPEVQIIEVESAKQKAEISRLKGELDEAVARRSKNASCDLSSDEFNGINSLLEKTRTSK